MNGFQQANKPRKIPMELSEFSKGAIWAIMPDKFEMLCQKFFEYNMITDQKMIDQFNAQTENQNADSPLYRIEGETAVIDIYGPLTKRASFFSFLFGGMSYSQISETINAALKDDRIRAIILNIDSPGGVVSGVEAVSDLVFAGRAEKPIVAYSNGMMASAAYWIGSAAEVLYAEKTALIGSIGVLRIHVDYSEKEKMDGIKTTYLTAGKYKALGNDSEPLSNEAKDVFQAELDYIYSIFVDFVARNRDVETNVVLSDMADGKVFFGNQALDAGLIDNVGNYRMAADMAQSMISNQKIYSVRGVKMEIQTVEQLIEAFPELVNQIQETAAKKAKSEAEAETKKAEHENILKLIEIQFGKDEAGQFKTLLKTGLTAEQFQAVKNLNPEPEPEPDDDGDDDGDDDAQTAALKAIQDAGADNPGPDSQSDSEKDYMTLCREYMAEHKVSMFEAQRAIDKTDPELRKKFIKRANQAA
jgi:signal peptide peptidase SppA